MVEDVEEFGAELQVETVEDLRALANGEIHIPELRSEARISAEIAESAIGRLRERRAIQIADHVRSRLPAGVDGIDPWDHVRALVEIRARVEVAVGKRAGVIGTHN